MTPQAAPQPDPRSPAGTIGRAVGTQHVLGPGLRGAEPVRAGRGGVVVAHGSVRRRRTKLRPAPDAGVWPWRGAPARAAPPDAARCTDRASGRR